MAAAQAAMADVYEPLAGSLRFDHVQLVQQGADMLDEGLAEVLVRA